MNMNEEYVQPVEEREEAIPTAYVVIGVLVLAVLGIVAVALIIFLATNYAPQLEAIRDVFIIALAFESCIFGIVLVLMLIMLIRLVNTVEFEIKPILEQTNETVNTVRGTSTFVSRNVVRPVVKTTSFVVGFRRGLATLFGDPRKNLPD
jgi:hypothetical protein